MNADRPQMKHLILLLSMLCPTSSLAGAGHSDAETTVMAVVTRFVHAQTDYDQPLLEEVLALDYTEISPLGQVDSRSEVIGFYGKEAAKNAAASGMSQTAELGEIVIDIGSDRARVTAREEVIVDRRGTKRSTSFRVSLFLQKSGAGWRIQGAQYTPIHAPAQ